MGNGVHTAGGRSGNDNHYIEHHERANKPMGMFQKKVKLLRKVYIENCCETQTFNFTFLFYIFRLDGQIKTAVSANTTGI